MGKVFGEATVRKEVLQEPPTKLLASRILFGGSLATGNSMASEDEEWSEDDSEAVEINANLAAVIEVRSARSISSLSRDTKDNSNRSDECVSIWAKRGERK